MIGNSLENMYNAINKSYICLNELLINKLSIEHEFKI